MTLSASEKLLLEPEFDVGGVSFGVTAQHVCEVVTLMFLSRTQKLSTILM